jgi:hypothetical protein
MVMHILPLVFLLGKRTPEVIIVISEVSPFFRACF